ncbi:MAG: CAP domain-containing protein [Deltaproteobacteria bacterium]|jgi:uncharacterized protein YkwD|nr:CAP domain-containing protein [Deltaproteobacteria bacterium]
MFLRIGPFAPFALALGLMALPFWLSSQGGRPAVIAPGSASDGAGLVFAALPSLPSLSVAGSFGVRPPVFAGKGLGGALSFSSGQPGRWTPGARSRSDGRRGKGGAVVGSVGIAFSGSFDGSAQNVQVAGGEQVNLAERKKVLELVNAARREKGAPPLAWNDALAKAAQLRAEELNRSFSHTRPDGSGFKTALAQFGITTNAWAENIAQGQPDADGVMRSWLNSKGHLTNIMDRDFARLGVGAFPHPGNGLSWVQLFIK